jgi:hypothetical protein
MCSLCGDLSTRPHWSEHAPGEADAAQQRRHRAARTGYARALLAAHGLTLAEWQGVNAAPVLTEAEAVKIVVAPEREAV